MTIVKINLTSCLIKKKCQISIDSSWQRRGGLVPKPSITATAKHHAMIERLCVRVGARRPSRPGISNRAAQNEDALVERAYEDVAAIVEDELRRYTWRGNADGLDVEALDYRDGEAERYNESTGCLGRRLSSVDCLCH